MPANSIAVFLLYGVAGWHLNLLKAMCTFQSRFRCGLGRFCWVAKLVVMLDGEAGGYAGWRSWWLLLDGEAGGYCWVTKLVVIAGWRSWWLFLGGEAGGYCWGVRLF